jgi:fructuronate reductase
MSGDSSTPLSRSAGDGRPAAPVRHVHLGLGNFFRAHQAWYTEHATDAADWGIAAFTGRSTELADALTAQDNLYTLVTRSAAGDQFEVLSSVSRSYPAADHQRLLEHVASADVRVLTTTITEAGYLQATGGGLARENPALQSDLAALRVDATAVVSTAPARLVAALAARRRADAGPISLISCDNLPDNGAVLARVLHDAAEIIDPALASWIADSVDFATTMVDRITPRIAADDLAEVAARTGRTDRAPVVSEPFSEWVLSGAFRAGRPCWDRAGAAFTDDIEPFEHRKLWLLNGGHSLLAYAGSVRGHVTIADAMTDSSCVSWLHEWWQEAAARLSLPASDVASYLDALTTRFDNPRIQHRLAQIATDGSQKLPIRVLPVLRAQRADGAASPAALRILAAWLCFLRAAATAGTEVNDPRTAELAAAVTGSMNDAARRLITLLDVELADDDNLIADIVEAADEISI